MTVCVGALTGLAMAALPALAFGALPAAAGLWASRRGPGARFLPALLFLASAAYVGSGLGWAHLVLGRPWMPTLLAVTGLLWLPRAPRPFGPSGRVWLSFATALSALTAAMLRWEQSTPCGLL